MKHLTSHHQEIAKRIKMCRYPNAASHDEQRFNDGNKEVALSLAHHFEHTAAVFDRAAFLKACGITV